MGVALKSNPAAGVDIIAASASGYDAGVWLRDWLTKAVAVVGTEVFIGLGLRSWR